MPANTTRFESLLEAVPDALVGMDQEGVIRFVNAQTESLFGFDRDQLIGQAFTTLVSEVFWRIYADLRDDYFANPATRFSGNGLELTGRQADGTEFQWGHIRQRPSAGGTAAQAIPVDQGYDRRVTLWTQVCQVPHHYLNLRPPLQS